MNKIILQFVLVIPKIFIKISLRIYGRLSKKEVVTLAGTNVRIKVDMGSGYGQELLKYKERPTELFIIPLMKKVLRPEDTFADIGAHWGIYSMVACQLVGEGGRVLAIEPFKNNCKKILVNSDLNHFRNLILVNKAVGEKRGEALLVIKGDGDNLSYLREKDSKGAAPFSKLQKCQVTDLRSVLDEFAISKIRMAKIDIEGGEYNLFKDLNDYTGRFELILIELHPANKTLLGGIAFIYDVLAKDRRLYVVDTTGAIKEILAFDHFTENLYNYYFISVSRALEINLNSTPMVI